MQPSTSGLVLASDAAIDLQMHTTYSDGSWTPEQLIDYLASEQFGLVAITDHDNLSGIAYLQQLGAEKQLPVLAAVEMSTEWNGRPTDLLCYGVNPEDKRLLELTTSVQRRQEENTRQVYDYLQRKGYAFPRQQEVLKEIGGEPRQANDLFDLFAAHGYDADMETLDKDLQEAGLDFKTNDIAEVVDAIHKSGAICIIAHPGRALDGLHRYDVALLDQLRQEVPIDGLEVYYPTHTPEQVSMFLDYAQKHHLLVSSGSDSHSSDNKPIKYRAELSRDLLERLGITISFPKSQAQQP